MRFKQLYKIKSYLFLIVASVCLSACHVLKTPPNKPLDRIVLITGDTLYGEVEYFKEEMVFSEFYRKIRLTEPNGRKKRFKRKNVLSYTVDGNLYERFTLRLDTRYFSNGSIMETRYVIDPNGTGYFLKLSTKGKLSHYKLEWIDRDNNNLTDTDLVIKNGDNTFIRASYGILSVAKKILSNYLSDCPEIQQKIMDKELKYVFEVVDFYNENCGQ